MERHESAETTSQNAALYAEVGVPNAYIEWKEFCLLFVCRDKGCKEYGKAGKEMNMLTRYLKTQKHRVCQSSSLIANLISAGDSQGSERKKEKGGRKEG